MGIAENKQIVRGFYEAANRGDMAGCFALLADDIKWTNMGSTRFSGCFVGKEDLTNRLLGPVFSQYKNGLRSTVDNVVAEGNYVVVQLRGEADDTGSCTVLSMNIAPPDSSRSHLLLWRAINFPVS